MKKWILLSVIVLIFASSAEAQVQGVFLGTTIDSTGNYVPEPDGFPDWEFFIKGLPQQPSQIILTANEDRRWQTPVQPDFWIVKAIPGQTQQETSWFVSIAGSVPTTGFHVQLTFPDVAGVEFDISSAIAVQPLSKLQWDQDAASLFEVQQLSARAYIDGSGTGYGIEPNKITCTGAEPTFTCVTPFPPIPLSSGSHTLTITMVNPQGFESGKSNTVSFVIAVVATPRNLRLIP